MRKKMIDYCLIGLLAVGIIVLIGLENTLQPISFFQKNVSKENVSKENVTKENILQDSVSPETATSEVSTEQNSQEEINYGIEVPYRWEETLDERNCINAVIDIPDCIRENGFQEAVGTAKEVSQEKILEMLEEYYHPAYDLEDDYAVMFRGEDNMFLSFEKITGGANLMTDAFCLLRMAYRDQPGVEDYNRDLYAVDKDLENFTLEMCDEKLSRVFDRFGIESDVRIIHRALDYQTMKEEAVELHEDGSLTRPDYEWTEADNSYHCTVSQLCNGIPIIPTYEFDFYADILNDGAHTFVLNKEKVVGFYTSDIYDIAYLDAYAELLEFSEVLAEYRESPLLQRDAYYTEITDITLRIMAVADGGQEYVMTPIWIFYGHWTDAGKTVEAPFAVMINGITGDEL